MDQKSETPMTFCPNCGCQIRSDMLERHLSKVHRRGTNGLFSLLPRKSPGGTASMPASRPLVSCEICGAELYRRNLPTHMRQFHPLKRNPLPPPNEQPEGQKAVNIANLSPEWIRQEVRNYVIDENGFLVARDRIEEPETKPVSQRTWLNLPSKPAKPPKDPFEKIRATPEPRRESPPRKPQRPQREMSIPPELLLPCPACQQRLQYRDMADHMQLRHRSKHPQRLMAELDERIGTELVWQNPAANANKQRD